jgi:DNA-binding response OmpR family regulator
MILRVWGLETRCVYDGESVEPAALVFHPHVVLLDIGLPRMSGCEVARCLRSHAEFDATVLIAITGYGRDVDHARTRDAGCDHHLTKPVEPELLRAMVTRARRIPGPPPRRVAEAPDGRSSAASAPPAPSDGDGRSRLG